MPDPEARMSDEAERKRDSRGGEHSYANTRCAHVRCNVQKGAREPEEHRA